MGMRIVPDGGNAIINEVEDGDYMNGMHRKRDWMGQSTLVDLGREQGGYGWYQPEQGVKAAVFEAAQGVERSVGFHGLTNVEATKDAQADIERGIGLHGAQGVFATKDAQADIERGAGLHYAGNVETVRSVGADLERSSGLHYADTVKTVKDVEVGLERAAGTRYGSILETVKDAEARLLHSDCKTQEEIKEVELALERSKARLVELIKDTQLESCKNTDAIKDGVEEARRELALSQAIGFRDNLIGFKEADLRAYKIAHDVEKQAAYNHAQTLIQFKEVQLQAERNAAIASKEMMECCCEMKELVKEEANVTRALINQQAVDMLRDRAAKAEQALLILNLQTGCSPLKGV